MAWDTQATQRKLLEAGVRQFALNGFAGTTMDAIGRDSGVNKERVYQYFGSKRAFFSAVLTDRLDHLLDSAPIEGSGPEAAANYAIALFDRYRESPELARLLAWESLELEEPAAPGDRRLSCEVQAASLVRAIPTLDDAGAEQLLLTIVTLVTGWWTLERLAELVLGPGSSAEDRREALRRQVAVLAEASTA